MIRFFKFACLWVAACSLAFLAPAQSNLQHRRKAFRTAPAAYVPYASSFNGTSNYMRMTTVPTGVTDGKDFTCSFWINLAGGDSASQQIFAIGDAASEKLGIYRGSTNKLRIFAYSSGGTTRLDATGSVNLLAADSGFDGSDGWTHVYIAIDLASTSTRKIYINGTLDASVTWTTYDTTTNIDLAPPTPRFTIGASTLASPDKFLNGSLSEFVFKDTYSDAPASYYSGTAPISPPAGMDLYFSTNGSGNSWATDSSGNGSNFTVTGTLGSPTAP